MLSLWKKRRKEIAKEMARDIFSETRELLEQHNLNVSNQISELKAELKEMNMALNSLERKLQIKDIKDRQQYGQLHYKLHEVKGNTDH